MKSHLEDGSLLSKIVSKLTPGIVTKKDNVTCLAGAIGVHQYTMLYEEVIGELGERNITIGFP